MDPDELRETIAHKRALIAEHTRRLRVLERQAAQFGFGAPPHIQLEIDEITDKVQSLEREIAALESRGALSAPSLVPGAGPVSLAGERRGVALDLSHQQRKWDRFAAFATLPKWQFRIVDQGILAQRAEVERAAALLLALPFACVLSRDEIDYIAAWVLAGGGLFLLGSYAADAHHMGNPSALARRFGLQFANDLILPAQRSSEADTRIQPRSLNPDLAVKIQLAGAARHPILGGVREVAALSACSVEIAADPEGRSEYLLAAPPDSAVMQPRGIVDEDGWMPVIERWELARHAPAPLLAAACYGRGRVVVSGSWKLCTLDYGDNARLVENILSWLVEPSEQ